MPKPEENVIREVTEDATVQDVEAKTQPWRNIWPAPAPASSEQLQLQRQANLGPNSSGAYGYNDKDEGSEK